VGKRQDREGAVLPDEHVVDAMRAVFDAGGNRVDTAEVYGVVDPRGSSGAPSEDRQFWVGSSASSSTEE
jgi:aryl-alcohol dehydrogenase-like predicted oxidoreductase